MHGSSWPSALSIIRTSPVEVAIVDPLLNGLSGEHEVERLRVLFPSIPLTVYTSLSPETASLLLRLGRLDIRQAVFVRHDDHPERLRSMLERENTNSLAEQFLNAVSGVLAPLPSELRWALMTMLRSPRQVRTVAELSRRARVDRRTCERWFSRAGLASPRTVLAATRLLYAHRMLQDPGYTVEDVANKLGYGQVRTLQAHARQMLGLTPGELRIALSPQQALEMIASRYFGIGRQAAQRAS